MESEACPMSHNALGVMEQLLNPNLSLEPRQLSYSIAVLRPLHNESRDRSLSDWRLFHRPAVRQDTLAK